MGADWTNTNLLANIRRRSFAPDASATGTTDSDLLAMASQELQSRVVPLIKGVREEYFVVYQDVPLVTGQAAYRLPYRSAFQAIRGLSLVDSQGTERHLTEIRSQDMEGLGPQASQPQSFYLQGNLVYLFPTPGPGTSLRFRYETRPNRLVAVDADSPYYREIAFAPSGGGGLSCISATPGEWQAGDKFDVIRATPGFDILAIDLVATATGGATVLFGANDDVFPVAPNDIQPGDYLCRAEHSPVAQVPPELQDLLSQCTASSVLRNMGDSSRFADSELVCKKLAEDAIAMPRPRVEASVEVVASSSPFFPVRSGSGFPWGNR